MKFYLSGETYRLSMKECQDRRSRLHRGTCIIRADGLGTYTFTYLVTRQVQYGQQPYTLTAAEYMEARSWLVD